MPTHPNADPLCEACRRAMTGICVQHAMEANPGSEDRKCKGLNRNGDRCKKWALADQDFCLVHQDDEAAAERAKKWPGKQGSRRAQVEKAVDGHMHVLGKTRADIDALEELSALAAESIQVKDMLRERMREAFQEGDRIVAQELSQYVAALERAAKLVEGYGRHGLEKTMVSLRQELTALVTAVCNQLIAQYVPADEQGAAISQLQRAVAAIEPPKELVA